MLPRYFSRRIPSRAGLPLLRTIRCVLSSLLLLCLSIGNLQAQTLPAGYELHPLGGGLNRHVVAVHAAGEDIYYGGEFTQAYNALDGNNPTEPVDRTNYIARWDGSQWHPLGRGTNNRVSAIASANDGSIYVGGEFTQVTQADGSTLTVSRIARFKNGQWSAVGSGVNHSVYALAVVEQPAGGHDLYVGGHFTRATDNSGTKTVNRLAKWDGTQWQALGAGVDNAVLSIVYSKARGGFYIGGLFTNANAFGSEAAVTLNRVGFWHLAEQQWQTMASGTTGTSAATFQETADSASVFVSGEGIGLKRFDWNTGNWTTLSTALTLGMQLLPDQQRLIALTSSSSNGLQLWDTSQATPVAEKLSNFSSDYILQTTATHHSDVYLGFSNVVDQYHYAARLVVPDMDGDGVANDDDICPLDALDNCLANPAADTDGDLVKNGIDNCPLKPNTDQLDSNKDGIGDACEPEQVTALSCKLKTFDNILNAETLSLSPDGRALFVGAISGNQLTRIDTRLHTHSQTTVGSGPWAVLASRDGQRVYVANHDSHTIQVLDAQSQVTLATVSSSNGVSLNRPIALAESADGNYLFIANYSNKSVAVMNTQSNDLVKSISVGSYPFALQVVGSGSHETLYVANHSSNFLSVLAVGDDNLNNWQSTQNIIVGNYSNGLSVNQQGYLYVTNESSKTISVIDTASNSVVSSVALTYTPSRSHLSADGRQLYVAAWSGTGVIVIDTELARTNPAQAVLHRWANIGSDNVDVQTLIGERRAYVSSRTSNKVTLLAINQVDRNGNGVGDDCDDLDSDGVIDGLDNCPGIYNPDQLDGDQDGAGDACDPFVNDPSEWLDTDNDGVGNNTDAFINNPAEWLDSDGDRIGDNADNCPLIANIDQADQDGDGRGDVCDAFPQDANEWLDSDNDGVGDNADVFPEDPTEWLDTDNDGIGDNADICPQDALDNCVNNPNADTDGDGVINRYDEFADDASKWRDGDVEERLGDAAKQNFGQVLVNLGDINNDFVDDYAVGTPNVSATVNGKKIAKAGQVQIFSGRTQAELFSKTGSTAKQLFGASIAAGDYNDDGVMDLAIGAPGYSKARGQVTVCLGAVVDTQWTCREKVLNHSVNGAQFGASLATQTVAGAADGLIVGAPKDISLERLQPKGNLFDLWQYSQTPKRAGSVSFYSGLTLSGNQSTVFPNDRVYGAVTGGLLGSSVSWLSDSQQIAAGAPKANKTGEVLLWDVAGSAFELLKGQSNGEQFGKVLAVGSLNDNAEHLIVSVPLAANGKLKQTGRVDVFDLAASNQPIQRYLGTTKAEQLGTSLAVDDKHNLFVGSAAYTAPKTATSKALKKAGKVSRFSLISEEAKAEIIGTQANQQFGASLAAIELTGDFKLDLLVGSIGANNPADKKLKAAGKLELINANDWQ